jgi:hypothetical protein
VRPGRGRAAALAVSVAVSVAVVVVSGPAATSAAADSFTPVRLAITIAPVARRLAPLSVTVRVAADPGVLDGSAGPVRIGVKLAHECGGAFQTTPGTTLLNAALRPQPATGKAYTATAHGSGRPGTYGTQTVCVYLEDTQVGRVYANDESDQVNVSRSCTAAAAGYDSAVKALVAAQRRLHHTRRQATRRRVGRTISADRLAVTRERRRGHTACGSGVRL